MGEPSMGIGEDTVRTAVGQATTNVRYLAEAQGALRARPSDPPGRTRPADPAAPIDLGILDHMVANRAELVAHTRAHSDVTGPVPHDEAEVYAWYEENSARLDEHAARVGEAIVYRQALEARVLARAIRGFWPERCPSCQCFSLRWHPAQRTAVCHNTEYDSENGRPRRFTLAQIAENVVENFTVRAAT